MATETQPASAAKKTGTEYVVLRRTRTTVTEQQHTVTTAREAWELVGSVTAATAEGAIQQKAEAEIGRPTTSNTPVTEVTLVAIPASSFRPRRVQVETVSKVTLADA